ncbi:MAG: YcxB family protein [Polyangiales bacterium]
MDPIVGHAVIKQAELARALNAGLPSGTLRYGLVLLFVLPAMLMKLPEVPGADPVLARRGLLTGSLLLALGLAWMSRMVSASALLGKSAGATHYELDALGFRISSEQRVTRRAWSAVGWCLEIEPAFLLFSGLAVPHLILKRAFAPEDVARVRTLIGPHGQGGEPLRLSRAWALGTLLALLASHIAFALTWRV